MASVSSPPGGDPPKQSEAGGHLLCGLSLSKLSLRPQVPGKNRIPVRAGLGHLGPLLEASLEGGDELSDIREDGLACDWAKKPTFKGQEDVSKDDDVMGMKSWVHVLAVKTLKGQEALICTVDATEGLEDKTLLDPLNISLGTENLIALEADEDMDSLDYFTQDEDMDSLQYDEESISDEDMEESAPYVKYLGKKGRCSRPYKNGKPRRFERHIKSLLQGRLG